MPGATNGATMVPSIKPNLLGALILKADLTQMADVSHEHYEKADPS